MSLEAVEGPNSCLGGPNSAEPVRSRVLQIVATAREFQSAIELDHMVHLLPESAPATGEALTQWFREHPGLVEVNGAWARPLDGPSDVPDAARRQRADAYWAAAVARFGSSGGWTPASVRFVGVTGSVAYGEATAEDDCDLMAITAPGAVWAFLAETYLRIRLRQLRGLADHEPRWCLNYVLDEGTAVEEYGRRQGFLFAREALSVRPIRGGDHYRSLLAESDWLREELPRLFEAWQAADAGKRDSEPARLRVRAASLLVYPFLAAYLQLKGLWANHRLRNAGRGDAGFRTVTLPGQMALQTWKFDLRSNTPGAPTAGGPR